MRAHLPSLAQATRSRSPPKPRRPWRACAPPAACSAGGGRGAPRSTTQGPAACLTRSSECEACHGYWQSSGARCSSAQLELVRAAERRQRPTPRRAAKRDAAWECRRCHVGMFVDWAQSPRLSPCASLQVVHMTAPAPQAACRRLAACASPARVHTTNPCPCEQGERSGAHRTTRGPQRQQQMGRAPLGSPQLAACLTRSGELEACHRAGVP